VQIRASDAKFKLRPDAQEAEHRQAGGKPGRSTRGRTWFGPAP
jgi:hypothetical protein